MKKLEQIREKMQELVAEIEDALDDYVYPELLDHPMRGELEELAADLDDRCDAWKEDIYQSN